jgi:hypothetical protein
LILGRRDDKDRGGLPGHTAVVEDESCR